MRARLNSDVRLSEMEFPKDLGVITCRCVMEQSKPVLFASRAGGDWQMYCHDKNHDFEDPQALKEEIVLVDVAHLLALDPGLNAIADLPIDMGAERAEVGSEWIRFADADDDDD